MVSDDEHGSLDQIRWEVIFGWLWLWLSAVVVHHVYIGVVRFGSNRSRLAPCGTMPMSDPESVLLVEAGQSRHSTECSYCGRPKIQRSLSGSLNSSLLIYDSHLSPPTMDSLKMWTDGSL